MKGFMKELMRTVLSFISMFGFVFVSILWLGDSSPNYGLSDLIIVLIASRWLIGKYIIK